MLTTAGSWRATLVAALFAFLLIAIPAQALPRASAFDASRLPAATAELVEAAAVPPGFTESVAFSGLTAPTAVRFAPDGRVVVAEKSGLVKVFDSLTDSTPTVLADLRTNVHDFWDRGLLGLALDPNFTVNGEHLRPLRLRQGSVLQHGAALARQLPDAAGRHRRRLRDQRPPVADLRRPASRRP